MVEVITTMTIHMLEYVVQIKKIMNVKVFSLIPRVNKTRFLIQIESCECKCRLNENVCNLKWKWDFDECRCKCKKLVDWSSSEDDYV